MALFENLFRRDRDGDGIRNREDPDFILRERKGLNRLFQRPDVQLERALFARAKQDYEDLLGGEDFRESDADTALRAAQMNEAAAAQAAAQAQTLGQQALAAGGQQAGDFIQSGQTLQQMLEDAYQRNAAAAMQQASADAQQRQAQVRDESLMFMELERDRRRRQIQQAAAAVAGIFGNLPNIPGLNLGGNRGAKAPGLQQAPNIQPGGPGGGPPAAPTSVA